MVRVLSSRQGHARSDVERAVMLSRAEERQASEQESVESCKVLHGCYRNVTHTVVLHKHCFTLKKTNFKASSESCGQY